MTPSFLFRTFALFATTSFTTISLPAIAEIQPRDLDGDPKTVEAYYEPSANITALAHPNLPLLESFGIPATAKSACVEGIFCGGSRPGIDRYGYMEWPTADGYITAMNSANYLGQSSWRLPAADFIYTYLYGWGWNGRESCIL